MTVSPGVPAPTQDPATPPEPRDGRDRSPLELPADLAERLAAVTLLDERRLTQRWRRLAGVRPPARRELQRQEWLTQLQRAEERLARRATAVPAITFPESLPVSQRVDDLAAAVRDHQVVVVAGETGSGKSTQLPKLCLQLGRGRRGMIGHTQPRRIAARALAERIAEETGTQLGQAIGYSVRFNDHTGPQTSVKLMTDGILLAEIGRDADLLGYDTIILDEAHERSLNIDFLLGYLVQLLPRRPDLKLIITSATIDPERFARHFSAPGREVPVIEVSGRTFPVEIRYRPFGLDALDDQDDAPDGDPDAVYEADRRATPDGPADQTQAICDALDELAREGDGDVLVFLSGEREITDTADAVRAHLAGRSGVHEVVPLYGRLSAADQHRVFSPHSGRRIVLSTNVAETSLTVPGIRSVIDPGTARISRYSPRTKVQRLPIEKVSQASAGQRAGRCGRVADGVCIRLYSEDDFAARPEFTDPEIVRTSLASVILQMASLRLGDIESFPFIDPPDRRLITDGITVLTELGALEKSTERGTSEDGLRPSDREKSTERGTSEDGLRPSSTVEGREGAFLTPTGRALAALPVDPRLARMIVEGDRQGCLAEILVVVAALTVVDVREYPLEDRDRAVASHSRFVDPRSDFLAMINLWQYLADQGRALSGNAFRRMCRREYLHWLRIREWQDLHAQLEQIARGLGMDTTASGRTNVGLVIEQSGQREPSEPSEPSEPPAGRQGGRGRRRRPPAAAAVAAPPPPPAETGQADQPTRGSLAVPVDVARVHIAVLAGLLSHLGSRPEGGREYLGTRGSRWMIWPGSALSRSGPPLAVAAELVETSRLWGRVVARVEPEWAEQVGGHLLKRSYSEPRWSAKRGATVATERVTLLGVTLFAARTVQFDRIDPELCRELFIRHALVERDWPTRHAFVAANQRAIDEIAEWEDRLRRRDLLDDDVLFAWYDQRIPADITDARRFDRWWKTQSRTEPGLLTFTAEQLVAQLQRRDAGFPDSELGRAAFPDTFDAGPVELDLDYTYDPARNDDGVSVTIPLAVLSRVDPAAFGRQIPGLRRDLAVALIRSLPKQQRRNFVPVPDFAAAALQRVDQGSAASAGLPEQLAAALTALTGVVVRAADFDLDKVPDHLRMTFKVTDERGRAVDQGKDLAALQHRLRADTRAAVASAVARDSRSLERLGLAAFPAQGVPRQVSTTVAGQSVTAYPALLDRGTVDGAPRVDLVVLTDPDDQRLAHRTGAVRLLGAGLTVPISFLRQALTRTEMMLLATSGHGSTTALVQDATVAVVDALLDWAGGPPWTPADFDARRERIAGQLNRSVLDVLHAAGQVVQAANAARERIDGVRGTALTGQVADLRARLHELVGGDFVARAGAAGLPDLVRYLQALEVRAQRLTENPDRDRQRMTEIEALTADADAVIAAAWQRRGLAALVSGRGDHGARVGPGLDPRVRELQRLLAEYRVALFAQPMRTAVPVSAKRIGTAVAELRATMSR